MSAGDTSGTDVLSDDPTDRATSERFHRLAVEWESESEFLSSPSAMAELPAYRAIIEMGRAAVPLILDELRREPDHWFVALKRITGDDPVPPNDRGDLDRMTEAWLEWGREHGIGGEPSTVAELPASRHRQSRDHEPQDPSL